MSCRVAGLIPAHWGSTRLPGKLLLDLMGKPVIQHVYERCMATASLDLVLVATDDQRIVDAVEAFGGQAVLTSPHHPNGTSRVAEVAETLDCSLVINIQGDEPFIDPAMIDLLVRRLDEGDESCATVAVALTEDEVSDANVVKVVTDLKGRALYFSRSAIPFARNGSPECLHHLGLYGYRKDFLLTYRHLPSTPLSETESLEQLRVLEHGYSMAVVVAQERFPTIGIDVAADLERAKELMSRGIGR